MPREKGKKTGIFFLPGEIFRRVIVENKKKQQKYFSKKKKL